MEITDPVYGTVTIDEPVLKDLIKSKPVQRLKEVHQGGPSPFFIDDKPYVTRFEHSIGVMLLLREFHASIEEQIAGLLHDVPHTAFSHVADFVFENEEHEYHEDFMEDIVYSSEIPEILENYDLEVDYILDESNFGLLERDLPDLCADRLDYSMRDLKRHEDIEVERFLESLAVEDGKFVFKDANIGKEFAEKFMYADRQWWANPREVAIYHLFAEALREALEVSIIEEEDLFNTDRVLLEKLRNSNNDEIMAILNLLQRGLKIEIESEDYDFIETTKARAVDPEIKGESVRVSEVFPEVGKDINEHQKRVSDGYKIKVVNS